MLLKKLSNSQLGLLCLISAQLCVSINIVVNKYLIQNSPAIILLALRFIISGIFLGGYLQYKNPKFSLIATARKLNKTEKISILLQGLFGGFLFNALMLTGLKFTSATMAGILSSLLPMLILVFSYYILKERIKKNEIISIIVATLGISFININKFSSLGLSLNLLGDALVLLALFPEALYTIVAKLYPVKTCPLSHSAMVNIINAFAFALSLLLFPSDIASLTAISLFDWVLIIAILSSAGFMFFILWSIGLKYSTTQQAGLVTAVVPAGSCLLAVIFLNEHIHLYELVGIMMIIMAIYIGTGKLESKTSRSHSSDENTTDLDEHDLITE